MIGEGLNFSICMTALAVIVASTLMASRVVPGWLALLLACIRVAVPFFFFALFDTGQWRFIDDLDYFYLSLGMWETGYTPWSILTNSHGGPLVSVIVGSSHTLFYWVNILAFSLFGPHYYAPIFLNIFFTFVSGYFLFKIADHLSFTTGYRQSLFVFFILHWDIVAWSSFVDLKDPVVLMLTTAAFLLIQAAISEFKIRYLIGLSGVLFLFTTIRHYVPPLVVLATAGWVLLQWRDSRKYILLSLFGLGALLLKPWDTQYMDYFQIQNPLYPALRFILMPQFWTVESPGEDFIEVPQFFHWCFFIPMLLGFLRLAWISPRFRLFLIYFGIMVLFYAVVPQLQGVRQRFQLSFVIIWGQFHFLWELHKFSISRSLSDPASRLLREERSGLIPAEGVL